MGAAVVACGDCGGWGVECGIGSCGFVRRAAFWIAANPAVTPAAAAAAIESVCDAGEEEVLSFFFEEDDFEDDFFFSLGMLWRFTRSPAPFGGLVGGRGE